MRRTAPFVLVAVATLCVAKRDDHYATLGVDRTASDKDIRKAYRREALRWHPDKNPDDREGSEARFIQVAEAYEVLGDERKRKAYDHGGTDLAEHRGGHSRHSPFDFARASEMFADNFGDALAKRWQPGGRVTGVLVRNGKRISITIHPDGTTEEEEVIDRSGRGGYTFVSQSSPSGQSVSISLGEGGLGAVLSGMVIPDWLHAVPLLGPALAFAVSWLPVLLCLGCCFTCLRGKGRQSAGARGASSSSKSSSSSTTSTAAARARKAH